MSKELHDQIMNIPCRRADESFTNTESRLLYKEGHRDARHDAAELAIGYVAEASPANGAVGEMPELPEPLEIDWPTLNRNALGCGVEDRAIHCRYNAAEYGWESGVDRAIECVPHAIYDVDQMQAYARAAVLAERAACEKACADSFSGFGGPIDDPAQDSILINGAIRDCITAIRART